MKYLGKNWYIYLFAAAMGFAAGAALDMGQEHCIGEACRAVGGLEGGTLLKLAFADMLFNGALYLWSAIPPQNVRRLMAAPALWLKMLLMGYFCRELIAERPAPAWWAILPVTLLGGGAVCLGLISRPAADSAADVRAARRQRLSLFGTGLITEGIILPSLVRTMALIAK